MEGHMTYFLEEPKELIIQEKLDSKNIINTNGMSQ